jgi:probable rRNA maturation factor
MIYKIDIQVDESFRNEVKEAQLRQAVERSLIAEGIDYDAELSLVVTDDETVYDLNLKYRNVDKTTDVLAFAFLEEPFVTPPSEITHLGEIIISYPQAERQAKGLKHSVTEELMTLVIHGVLHLLGYDDENEENARKMREREGDIRFFSSNQKLR